MSDRPASPCAVPRLPVRPWAERSSGHPRARVGLLPCAVVLVALASGGSAPAPDAGATGLEAPAPLPRPATRVDAAEAPGLRPPLRAAPVDTAGLQRALDSLRSEMDLPGASAAVILPDGAVWTGASGFAAPGEPATPDHGFEVGSITKAYTAALVLDLVASGDVSLDDAVAELLPDVEVPNADRITVRHLLRHTSGLHAYSENPEYLPALRGDFARRWTPEEVLGYMQEPHAAPGEAWHYSNANYQLLGMIVEAATGASFGRALRARVFDPLGLDETYLAAAEEPAGPTAHAYLDVTGDGEPEDLTSLVPLTSFHTAAWAAGAVVARARDAAAFLRALWSGPGVVSDSLYREMTTWVDRGDGMQYGFGVIRAEADGGPLLGHKGNSAGFSASAWHDPDADVTVVVLTNAHAVDVTPAARTLLERARESGAPR